MDPELWMIRNPRMPDSAEHTESSIRRELEHFWQSKARTLWAPCGVVVAAEGMWMRIAEMIHEVHVLTTNYFVVSHTRSACVKFVAVFHVWFYDVHKSQHAGYPTSFHLSQPTSRRSPPTGIPTRGIDTASSNFIAESSFFREASHDFRSTRSPCSLSQKVCMHV